MATSPAPIYNVGPYSNPGYNNDAVLQYAQLWGVDPSQVQYVPGQGYVQAGGAGSTPSFQPTYQSGNRATGGGVTPSPLNPTNYASPQTSQQVANLVGGRVTPDTAMGTGAGSSINIPTPNGIALPGGQTMDAGVLANVLSRYPDPQSAAQQLYVQSGGAINVTPQQIQQWQSSLGPGAGGGAPAGGAGGAPATPLGRLGAGQTNATLGTNGQPSSMLRSGGILNPDGSVSPSPTSSPGSPGGSAFAGNQTNGPTGVATPSNYQPPAGTYGGPGNAGYSGVYNYSSATPFEPGGIAIPGGPTPAGYNPAFPNWNQTTAANNPGSVNNPVGNVSATIGGEYGRALDYGNTFQDQFNAQYTQDIGRQNAYQTQSDAAYSDLYNTPGYTTQEAGAITGSPYSVMSGVDQTNAALRSNLAGTNAAIFGTPGTPGTPGTAGYLNPQTLTLSDDWVRQQQENAGRQIGLQYGAAQDQLQRQAEAAGNVNPLALAAGRQDILRQQGIAEADASTSAAIQARQAQLDSQQKLAGEQVQAATTIGQLGQGAAEFGGQLGYTAGSTAEQLAAQRAAAVAGQRIQGQQAARNYWTGQQQWFGTQGQSAAQNTLAGAQTSLGAMGQAATTAANTSLGRQSYISAGPYSGPL